MPLLGCSSTEHDCTYSYSLHSNSNDVQLSILVSLGYSVELAQQALLVCRGDMQAATEYCMQRSSETPAEQPSAQQPSAQQEQNQAQSNPVPELQQELALQQRKQEEEAKAQRLEEEEMEADVLNDVEQDPMSYLDVDLEQETQAIQEYTAFIFSK